MPTLTEAERERIRQLAREQPPRTASQQAAIEQALRGYCGSADGASAGPPGPDVADWAD